MGMKDKTDIEISRQLNAKPRGKSSQHRRP